MRFKGICAEDLATATFSDDFTFTGKAPLKVVYTNSQFAGRNADNITIGSYEGEKIFDSEKGEFTLYVDADIYAKNSDGSPLWFKMSDSDAYLCTFLIEDKSTAPVVSSQFGIILINSEKQPIENSGNSSASGTAASSSSGSATQRPATNAGNRHDYYDYDDDKLNDIEGSAVPENPSAGIPLAIAPVALAAGAVIVCIRRKK